MFFVKQTKKPLVSEIFSFLEAWTFPLCFYFSSTLINIINYNIKDSDAKDEIVQERY